MKGTDGVNVIQKIAAGDYDTFGMCLLQDENGVTVDLIKKNNRQEGAEGITRAILKDWLRNGPEQTRTYEHLIKCLRECELGELADDIVKRTTGGGKPVHSIVLFLFKESFLPLLPFLCIMHCLAIHLLWCIIPLTEL